MGTAVTQAQSLLLLFALVSLASAAIGALIEYVAQAIHQGHKHDGRGPYWRSWR